MKASCHFHSASRRQADSSRERPSAEGGGLGAQRSFETESEGINQLACASSRTSHNRHSCKDWQVAGTQQILTKGPDNTRTTGLSLQGRRAWRRWVPGTPPPHTDTVTNVHQLRSGKTASSRKETNRQHAPVPFRVWPSWFPHLASCVTIRPAEAVTAFWCAGSCSCADSRSSRETLNVYVH